MSFSINRTNNKIVKKIVSLTSTPTINTNVFEETYQIVSSTNSIITLPSNSNNNSNYYNNWYIKILSGNGINQIRQIQSYNSINKQLSLKTNLEIILSSNDSIILYNKLNSNIIWQESNNRFAPVFMKNSSNLNQMGETVDYLDFGCNNLTILSNKQSHSTSSGSLIVNGGAGITGTVNIGNSLNVTNSISCNNLSVNGISITGNLSNVYLTDIVPGTASISKALVLNSSGNISGINSLTSTNLLTNNFTLNGILLTASAAEINKLTGTSAVTSDFNKLANITASATEINKLTGTMVVTSDFNKLANVNSTATELNYLDLTTGPGTAEINKSLVLNSSGNISGINSLTSTNLLATNFTLNGTLLTTSGAELNKLTGTTAVTSDFNKLASITASATELNYLSGLTLGTITASKSITVDSSSNINSILRLKKTVSGQQIYLENGTSTGTIYHDLNGSIYLGTISANNLIFQTQNTNRVTITSAGLMNILGGWQISGTTVTSSAAEINYLDFSTGSPGTAEANKALILNTDRDISNIRNLTATNLTSSGNINISNTNAAFRMLALSDNIIYLQAGLNTTTGSSADIFIGNYGQDTAGSSRKIIFKGNGRLGLGTSNPQSLLDFGQNATDSTINLYTHGTTNETFKIGANGSLIKYQSGSSAGHAWYTGSTTTSTGAESMRLNNLNALSVNTSNANAIMNILGSSNYVDNSYNKVLRCSGANASPVNVEIQCHSGSSTTSTNAGWIGTVSNNDLRLGANSTTFFTIKANGNIGINNTNPGYKLDINGSYWATGGEIHTGTNWSNNGLHHSAYGDDNILYRLISKGYVLYPGGAFQHQFGASENTSLEFLTNNTSRMFISKSGDVGIGITSPSYKLDVSGTINSSSVIRSSNYIYVSDAGNYGRYIGNWSGAGYWGIGAHSSNQVRIGTCDSTGNWTGYANTYMGAVYAANTISLTVDPYGWFNSARQTGGTGAALTNNYAGYFNGRIACNGELNVISDFRMKNNIQPLSSEYCKNFINNTNPVSFNYNNDDSQKHFGYIAQDVFKAGFTDLVAFAPSEGLNEVIEEDGFTNPKDIAFVMSTNEIIPILAKNIKIIYQENEEQKNKITNLENENQQLKDQIQNILLRLQNLENN